MSGRASDTNQAARERTGGDHRASSPAYDAADFPAGRTTDGDGDRRIASDAGGQIVSLFPAGGPRRGPTAAQTDAVLAAFLTAERLSLRRLRLLVDQPHDLVVRCVERLEAEGLVAVESRPDGNESRGIAALTDEGRLRCGANGEAG